MAVRSVVHDGHDYQGTNKSTSQEINYQPNQEEYN